MRHPGPARPIQQFAPPIRRSRLGAWWAARRAVRAQMTLQDYLQWRRAHYQRRAPQQRYPLPCEVSIVQGEVVRTPNPEADTHPGQRLLADPAGEETLEAAVVRALRFRNHSESQLILREFQQYEEEVSRLTARLMEVSETLEERAVDQQREIATGVAPVPATLARARGRRGRPRQAVPWGPLTCALVIAVTVLVEAWQFALPYLNATGVDVSNLAAEWHRNPLATLLGSSFALAAAAAVFLLWYVVIERTVAIAKRVNAQPWWKTAGQALAPLVLGGLLLLTTCGIGAMRHGFSHGARDLLATLQGQAPAGRGSEAVFVLLTLIVPLAVAYLQHTSSASDIWEQRQHVRAQQVQWDQAEAEALLVRERRAELMRLPAVERDRLERKRDEARRKLRELAEYAQAIEGGIREWLEAARRFGLAYVHSLVAALEQDRYFFLKAARPGRAEARAGGWPWSLVRGPRAARQARPPGAPRAHGPAGWGHDDNEARPGSAAG